MIGIAVQIITEYVGIILCIHKAAGKRIKINWQELLCLVCYVVIVFVAKNISYGKLLLYAYLYVYTRMKVADTWKDSVKSFFIMMCTIPMLQLLLYGVISDMWPEIVNIY
ncbi:MAG: hypothetical protein K2N89_10150, partial [Lachnospiraceae bacterium]|nr:hypothetical protein [Lachnospiraceae bacterium]